MGRCIDSIIKQSIDHSLCKIIIVNDGSTDYTEECIYNIVKDNPSIRFQIITQNNKGQSAARNLGLKYAMGDYIWFIDADDIISPNCMTLLINKIYGGEYDVVALKYLSIEEGASIVLHELKDETFNFREYTGLEYIKTNSFSHYVWSYIINRNIISKARIEFEEGKLVEDAPYVLNLLLNTRKLILLGIKAYIYIRRKDSDMHTRSPQRLNKLIEGFKYEICN